MINLNGENDDISRGRKKFRKTMFGQVHDVLVVRSMFLIWKFRSLNQIKSHY